MTVTSWRTICAEGYRALLAVNRGDLALADSLAADAESAVGRTLSESHFVAMFPALARARLELRRADWAGAWRAATTAVERGRHGAGRVELAARTAHRSGGRPDLPGRRERSGGRRPSGGAGG